MPNEPQTRQRMEVILARLEQTVETMNEDVKDIKKRVFGNGHPGIVVDQEKQNANIEKLLAIAERNANAIESLKTETPTKFFAKNWRTLLLLAVAFFLVLHSLIPADLSLWSWISKVLGGP